MKKETKKVHIKKVKASVVVQSEGPGTCRPLNVL